MTINPPSLPTGHPKQHADSRKESPSQEDSSQEETLLSPALLARLRTNPRQSRRRKRQLPAQTRQTKKISPQSRPKSSGSQQTPKIKQDLVTFSCRLAPTLPVLLSLLKKSPCFGCHPWSQTEDLPCTCPRLSVCHPWPPAANPPPPKKERQGKLTPSPSPRKQTKAKLILNRPAIYRIV